VIRSKELTSPKNTSSGIAGREGAGRTGGRRRWGGNACKKREEKQCRIANVAMSRKDQGAAGVRGGKGPEGGQRWPNFGERRGSTVRDARVNKLYTTKIKELGKNMPIRLSGAGHTYRGMVNASPSRRIMITINRLCKRAEDEEERGGCLRTVGK